jgi:ATP-dependent Clp protease ATP-binding subunit ClpA
MARVIQENIKKPLADEVLFGKLQSGGTVRILLEVDPATGEEKLGFRYLSRDEEKALPRPPERKALPRASNGGGAADGEAKRRPPKKPGRMSSRKPEPA